MTNRLFAILVLLAGTVTAPNTGQRPVLRTSAEAVVVDVAVWDEGRPVRGLSAEDFELTDNGVPQQISVVAMGRGPIRVHVIADLGVAERPLRDRIRAAVALVAAAAPPEDELFLYRTDAPLQQGIPRDHDGGWDRLIQREPTAPDSAIFDAIQTAVASARSSRSLILVLGPGQDDSSWVEAMQIRHTLLRSRVTLSLIAFPSVHSAPIHGFARTLDREASEWRVRPLAAFATVNPSLTGLEPITSLCDTTGGTAWDASDDEDLANRIRMLLEEFRLRYEIAYIPSGVRQAGWHEIGLTVKSRRVDRISWRRGYQR